MKKKMVFSFIVVATVMSFISSSYSNDNTNDLLLDNIRSIGKWRTGKWHKMHRRRNGRLPYWYQSRSSNQILWFRITHETHLFTVFSLFTMFLQGTRKRENRSFG